MQRLIILGLTLSLIACSSDRRGGGGGSKQEPTGPTISGLTMQVDLTTLEVGSQARATVSAQYSDNTSVDFTQKVGWLTNAPTIATVNDGLITAVGEGLATITATHATFSATTDITVTAPADPLQQIQVTPRQIDIERGQTAQLSALGSYLSGNQQDVSSLVTWTAAPTGIVDISATGLVSGIGAGQTTIVATFGTVSSIGIAVTVTEPPQLIGVEVSPQTVSLSLGSTSQLIATAVYDNNDRQPVTATWSSSAPGIASVSASGQISGVADGSATITATYNGLNGTASVQVSSCAYPSAGTSIQANQPFPNISWTGAYDASGNTFDFSTEMLFCDPAYQSVASIHFIIGAGWCPNCPDYIEGVATKAAEITAAGGMLVWVNMETSGHSPASNLDAYNYFDTLIGTLAGPRVGDGDVQPSAGIFSRALSGVPSAFIVRKSDMVVVADQGSSQYILDFIGIAQNISGITPPSNCGPSDEESSEPNNQPAQSATLAVGSINGGICDSEPDFYQISHAGSWQIDLLFSHSTGDLDVYAYDTSTNSVLEVNGSPVGSESTDDNESFTHQGPTTIIVVGYQGATAPYQLTLTGI